MDHRTPDGRLISVAVDGPASAPPIVLIHALGMDTGLWDAQLTPFAARYRVWRYDLRGHGRSESVAGDYAIEALAADLLSVLDANGVSRAHLCGLSIGGLIAQWIACHAPERVDRLVLASTAARLGDAARWDERIRAARTSLAALAAGSADRWLTAAFRAREPDLVNRLRRTMASTSLEGYIGCCAALRDADFRQSAGRIRAATLVISGAHDVATTPAEGQWLARAIGGARYAEVDAAHFCNVEAADAFNTRVLAFLDGREEA